MANFGNIKITNEGRRLLAKAEAESLKIQFSKVQTSTDTYTEDELLSLTAFKDVRQETSVAGVTFIEPDKVQVTATISNRDLQAGYNVNSYGIFAKTELSEDFLFACASVRDGKADWMIPFESASNMSIHINAVMLISNIDSIKVTVGAGDSVTYPDFEAHVDSGGKQNVHGSTSQATNNTIITRDDNASAKIGYPSNPANDTIVNKIAMDTAIKKAIDNIGDVGVPQEAVINYYMPNAVYKVGDVVAIETTLAERVPTVKPTEPEPEPEPEQPTPEQPTNPDDKKDDAGGDNTGDSGNSGTEPTEPTEPDTPNTPSGDTERVKVVSIGDTIQVGAAIYEAIDNVYEDEGFTDIKTNPTKYPDIWQFKRWAI